MILKLMNLIHLLLTIVLLIIARITVLPEINPNHWKVRKVFSGGRS